MWTRKAFVLLAVGACICGLRAYGQDAQSLGDVARQSRLQKQQKEAATKETPAKDTSAKDAHSKDGQSGDAIAKDASAPKTPHVITNDEIPSHTEPTVIRGPRTPNDRYSQQPSSAQQNFAAEQWKSQIQSQKSAIASLQHEIDSVSESIRYAGANCVANCVQWNEHQKQKQDQVERMKEQLEQQQKRLEDIQEMARRQGLGSAVYDP